MPQPDFHKVICTDDFDNEDEEDQALPPNFLKLIEREEKFILPHKEPTEMVNLGSEEDPKEVRVGTSLSAEQKDALLELLKEFVDVFAWSYQDMPGLDTSIVMHKLPIKEE